VATGTKRSRDEQLLISAAETIGSTLGAIAAKAEAATKALRGGKVLSKAGQVTKPPNQGKTRSAARGSKSGTRRRVRAGSSRRRARHGPRAARSGSKRR
jgi:hypothetical protein